MGQKEQSGKISEVEIRTETLSKEITQLRLENNNKEQDNQRLKLDIIDKNRQVVLLNDKLEASKSANKQMSMTLEKTEGKVKDFINSSGVDKENYKYQYNTELKTNMTGKRLKVLDEIQSMIKEHRLSQVVSSNSNSICQGLSITTPNESIEKSIFTNLPLSHN